MDAFLFMRRGFGNFAFRNVLNRQELANVVAGMFFQCACVRHDVNAAPDQEVVLVNARLAVVGELPALPEEPALPSRSAATPRSQRRVYLDAWREVPVYDLDAVAPGQVVVGPAIVEAATTTALLRAGERATVTPLGWLDIRIPR